MAITNKKQITKSKILSYMIQHYTTSKVELSRELELSMPTVLTNVSELTEAGMIAENGEYASTGGRKAKSLGLNPDYRYAVGIVITANHAGIVLVNFKQEIEKVKRVRFRFSPETSYVKELERMTEEFLADVKEPEKILGIGISIPGIIDQENQLVIKSHALGLDHYSLNMWKQIFTRRLYFVNDANAAMMSEDLNQYKNAIYLSLNHTLGGAFCIDGKLVEGENHRAGEFGHMILVPEGRRCYCGKKGCADAYCAASVLTEETGGSMDRFIEQLQAGENNAKEKWNQYLNHLAILVSNLRMAYDMDMIVGGEVGGYLTEYMLPLREKVMEYNGFEHDARYLKNCAYKREASAVGAAKYFLQEFVNQL